MVMGMASNKTHIDPMSDVVKSYTWNVEKIGCQGFLSRPGLKKRKKVDCRTVKRVGFAPLTRVARQSAGFIYYIAMQE